MERTILHCDLNNFFASVECLHNPSIADKPVAVCGKVEDRHGIVLAKNNLAKAKGVQTGQAVWQAKQLCPELITVPPDFSKYTRCSSLVRKILLDYTDLVEPFGIDEAWLDVTGSMKISGNGAKIADTIRQRIKQELGLTASVGVSWNKVFAKLGSDMKKPDATTIITKDNYKEVVWPLPAKELLYVGRATSAKLHRFMINTIGQLARTDPIFLRGLLGKPGEMLWNFANGQDTSPVLRWDNIQTVKSVGNSTTTPRDITCEDDAKAVIYVLCDSVAARLRGHGLRGDTVQLWIRDCRLEGFVRQISVKPTCLTSEICDAAMKLLHKNWSFEAPLRSLGVSVSGLSSDQQEAQLSLYEDQKKRQKLEVLERETDNLRRRFGHSSVQRACLLVDTKLTGFNPKDDNTTSFLK